MLLVKRVGAMKGLLVVLATLGAVTMGAAPARAGSLGPNAVTGPNGHCYDIIFAPQGQAWNWNDAKADAEAKGGHLATISSAAEKAAIESHTQFASSFTTRFGFGFGPWLGGFLSPHGSTDTTNADAPGAPVARNGSHLWYWVNGEGSFSDDGFKNAQPVPPGTFVDWLAGFEPNRDNAPDRDEFFLAYGDVGANGVDYGWADMPNDGEIGTAGQRVIAYVLEVEPTAVPTPLAAGPGLLLLGGLALRRWRDLS